MLSLTCMTHTHTVVTKISTTPSGIPSVGFISSPLKKNDQRNNTFSKNIENKEKIYNFIKRSRDCPQGSGVRICSRGGRSKRSSLRKFWSDLMSGSKIGSENLKSYQGYKDLTPVRTSRSESDIGQILFHGSFASGCDKNSILDF